MLNLKNHHVITSSHFTSSRQLPPSSLPTTSDINPLTVSAIRLAPDTELQRDLANGTGCNLDTSYVWTSDRCGSDNASFMVALGASSTSGEPVRKATCALSVPCNIDNSKPYQYFHILIGYDRVVLTVLGLCAPCMCNYLEVSYRLEALFVSQYASVELTQHNTVYACNDCCSFAYLPRIQPSPISTTRCSRCVSRNGRHCTTFGAAVIPHLCILQQQPRPPPPSDRTRSPRL